MSNTRFYLLSLVVILATALSSCTRPSNDTSSLQISLPSQSDNSKLAAGDLDHVFISITGPNMPPIEFQWEKCKNCPSGFTAPSSFSIDVPSGSDRLVQVLAVYEASTSESVDIYYGDLLKTLTSGTQDLPISVSKVVSNTVVRGGRWAGRYITSGNTGPSGVFEAKFNPGSGKPLMLIDRSNMLGGWFGTIVLEGLNLSYFLNGAALFSEISTSSSIFTPSPQVAKVSSPKYFKQDGGGTTRYPEDSGFSISGYWGPGVIATSNFVCRENSGAFTKLYTQAVGGSVLSYAVDSAPSATAITVQGGMSCGALDTALKQYTNYLYISAKRLEDNGPMLASGFLHFFSMVTGDNGEEHVIGFNNTTKGVRIKPIPGAAAGVVDEVIAYKWISINHQDFFDRSPCEEVASGAMKDWIYAGKVATNGEAEVELSHNVSATEMTNAHLLLCPVVGGRVFNAGLMLPLWKWNMNSGTPGSGGPATKVKFRSNPALAEGSFCTRIEVVGATAEGYEASFQEAKTFTITVTNGLLFSSSSCTGGTTTASVSFAANERQKELYLQEVGTIGDLISLSTSPSTDSILKNIKIVGTSDPIRFKINPMWSAINSGTCKRMDVQLVTSSESPAAAINDPVTVNYSGPITLYTDISCSGGNEISNTNGTISLAAGVTGFYVKAGAPSLTNYWGNISLNWVDGSSYSYDFFHGIRVGDSSMPTQMNIVSDGSNVQNSGMCQHFTLAFLNDADSPAVLGPNSQIYFHQNVGPGTFATNEYYSDATCTTLLPINFGSSYFSVSGQSSADVYVRMSDTGGINPGIFAASLQQDGSFLLNGTSVPIPVVGQTKLAVRSIDPNLSNSDLTTAEACAEVHFSLEDSTNTPILNYTGMPVSATIQSTNTSSLTLHNTSDCSDTGFSSHNVIIPTLSSASNPVYVKYVGSGSATLQISSPYSNVVGNSFGWAPWTITTTP